MISLFYLKWAEFYRSYEFSSNYESQKPQLNWKESPNLFWILFTSDKIIISFDF